MHDYTVTDKGLWVGGAQHFTYALHLCWPPRAPPAAAPVLSSLHMLAQGADDALGDLADAQVAAEGL